MIAPAIATKAKAPARGISPEWLKAGVYVFGMAPAVWYIYLGLTDNLGADPVKTLEKLLGLWSLRFLVAGLAITPLRKIGGNAWNFIRYRRAIGLLAFFYAVLHLTAYIWLDQNFNAAAILKDILKRPYITIGMLAFAILIPLAITSNATMIKRLGGAAWQKLHKWVYLAVPAACVHFILLQKRWPPEPLVYAAIVAALLGWRVWNSRDKRKAVPASKIMR